MDQPARQREKRERLASAAIPIPANLTYVAVDFETDPLQPAFLSWPGVIVYLRREAIESVFCSVASLPPSSEIVFTFGVVRKAGAGPSAHEARAEALGEPRLSHFEPEAIEQMLRGMGFSEVSFLTPDEIERRYIHGRQDGLYAMRRISIASARV